MRRSGNQSWRAVRGCGARLRPAPSQRQSLLHPTRCRRHPCSLVNVLYLFVLIVVEVVLVILFLVVLVVLIEIILLVVDQVDFVGTRQDEVLAAFRTAQGIPLFEVIGVNLVELALWA